MPTSPVMWGLEVLPGYGGPVLQTGRVGVLDEWPLVVLAALYTLTNWFEGSSPCQVTGGWGSRGREGGLDLVPGVGGRTNFNAGSRRWPQSSCQAVGLLEFLPGYGGVGVLARL